MTSQRPTNRFPAWKSSERITMFSYTFLQKYGIIMSWTKQNLTASNPETVTISRAEYEKFQAQSKRISELESRVDVLMEALRLARHKQFGASSEKSEEPLMEQLSFLFNEAEVFAEVSTKQEEAVVVAAHKRHKKHEYTLDNIPEGIPTKQVEHRLEGEELVCPRAGDTMTEIGKGVIHPSDDSCQRHHSSGRLSPPIPAKADEKADEGCETPMVKAPKEKNIIPGSFATPEAVAHIMTQKFVMGCPLYRQEQDLNRRGIPLSRQTMSNWILRATENYLTPVYEQMHKELLRREVLHADETTLQVLHEPGKAPQSESYMWLYRTSGDTNKPIVLYEYQPGRGAKHPEAFLKGFKGYLHTDGYAGYHNLPEEITVVGCWAHARRKFDEAVRSLPKGKAKGSSASQGLTYCNLLFRMEQEIADKTAEERYEERLKQAKPVLDAMFAWANSRTAAPKSALGKALNYLKEQWPYLTNYLKDGRLELSNNRAERSIKPFVIDRKNFLFANTPKGAAGSAVMFSLIQTTMENGLDPYRYLTWLMHTANHADLTDTQVVQSLLPWNAPAELYTK